MAKNKSEGVSLAGVLPWLLLICGVVGIVAASVLTVELIDHYKNPGYVPVCNLNPVFSCSNVTLSDQAHAFGFPNEFIGIAGWAVVATVGGALLAGASFKRWFWRLLNIGLLFAAAFITWLQFQTLYRIGALCLFCMVTWAVTIPAFWYVTIFNLRESHLPTPKRWTGIIRFLQRHHTDVVVLWFLIIIALVLKRFWYYFGSL